MAKTKDAKKALEKSGSMGIKELIEKSTKELGKALPSHMNPERIVRIALTTLRMNPKLYNCEPMSFLGALFQSAQLGLEPNIEGQSYIIPYGNQAQFQIGYKGLVELFYRHQAALSLDMQEVRENDDFSYSYGTNSHLDHKPALRNRGDVTCYYAVAKMQDGASIFKVMSLEECIEHGKRHSKAFKNGPWVTDRDAMCKKTVLIQLMKLVPKSIEIQRALAMDSTTKSKIDVDMFSVPDETKWADAEDVTEAESKKEDADPEPPKDEADDIVVARRKRFEEEGLYNEEGK